MAASDLTAGRAKIKKFGIGGVQKLFLMNFLADAFTIVDGVVTAKNIGLTVAYGYALDGDGQVLVEEKASGANTGSSPTTQTITAIIKKQDAATSLELNNVAHSFPIAIVKSNNGDYHLVGQTNGVDFSIAATTGGASGDGNLYTLTGISTELNLSPILNAGTVTAFEAIVLP
mgnify:CR=1 FL=1